MQLSIADDVQAADVPRPVELRPGENTSEHTPRKRRPRKTVMDRELEAYRQGYAAGVDTGGGSAVILLGIGALSGAAVVAIAWTLVHFLG